MSASAKGGSAAGGSAAGGSAAGGVLLTGAAGQIGRVLRAGLPPLGWELRGLDIVEGSDVRADVTDVAAVTLASEGCAAVVHMAGISGEASWPEILRANIDGTYAVLEAARRAGVGRVVLASSNHAVGFTPRSELAGVDIRPRPDTYYGVSKVAGEALGSLYADRYGLDVVCLRIGSQLPRPLRPRHLATWLSDADTVRLVDAALRTSGFAVVYGISANTRRWWDLEPGRALGFDPVDDAEAYAAEIIAAHGEPDLRAVTEAFIGGEYAGAEFDSA